MWDKRSTGGSRFIRTRLIRNWGKSDAALSQSLLYCSACSVRNSVCTIFATTTRIIPHTRVEILNPRSCQRCHQRHIPFCLDDRNSSLCLSISISVWIHRFSFCCSHTRMERIGSLSPLLRRRNGRTLRCAVFRCSRTTRKQEYLLRTVWQVSSWHAGVYEHLLFPASSKRRIRHVLSWWHSSSRYCCKSETTTKANGTIAQNKHPTMLAIAKTQSAQQFFIFFSPRIALPFF